MGAPPPIGHWTLVPEPSLPSPMGNSETACEGGLPGTLLDLCLPLTPCLCETGSWPHLRPEDQTLDFQWVTFLKPRPRCERRGGGGESTHAGGTWRPCSPCRSSCSGRPSRSGSICRHAHSGWANTWEERRAPWDPWSSGDVVLLVDMREHRGVYSGHPQPMMTKRPDPG